jgi:NAD-dependent deacetylase
MQGKIFMLTGAGISAESGLETYRSVTGIWQSHKMEEVATRDAFLRAPEKVWQFFALLKAAADKAVPNSAHRAIAASMLKCKEMNIPFFLVTQNIDTLHERALAEVGFPVSDCIAMHGRLSVSSCVKCRKSFNDPFIHFDSRGIDSNERVKHLAFFSELETLASVEHEKEHRLPLSPCCKDLLKPSVVLFGEEPQELNKCYSEVLGTSVFVAVGTSGKVAPANEFARWAVRLNSGVRTIFVNTDQSAASDTFNEFFTGPATEQVPFLISRLLS